MPPMSKRIYKLGNAPLVGRPRDPLPVSASTQRRHTAGSISRERRASATRGGQSRSPGVASASSCRFSAAETASATPPVGGNRVVMKFIDIGANLLDPMYQGQYNGKSYHNPDLPSVLQRAWDAGIDRMIITAGNLEEARAALELAKTDARLFCTAGVHPTRCSELQQHPGGEEAYVRELLEVIREGKELRKVVALGECGLDYDRLHFCDKETQIRGFSRQLRMAEEADLPMFLHMRAAATDFVHLCHQHSEAVTRVGGVVHSFDGTLEDLNSILDFQSLCIGINGCSLKTEENLDVMAAVPSDRLMLETDCPWCDIRPSHAGKKYVTAVQEAKDKKKHAPQMAVKGRNEPCNIRQVLEVVAGHRGVEDAEALSSQIYATTAGMFFPDRP